MRQGEGRGGADPGVQHAGQGGADEFAVEAAKRYLKYYDHYFGIKYPMPKLDLIAIPDFEAGAMENFGASPTARPSCWWTRRTARSTEKKRVAVTVAHEMAHQWFGDMVTMQWWDNLWLNEGFATWMETKAASEWQPEWEFPEDDATGLDETLNLDARADDAADPGAGRRRRRRSTRCLTGLRMARRAR